MCRHRKSSLPSSGQHCLCFVSFYSLVPYPQAKKKLGISRHIETLFVVSQATVSCWLGNRGVGLPEYGRWEKQKYSFTGSCPHTQNLSRMLSALLGLFSATRQKQQQQQHSLFWCHREMEKLEGIFKQFLMESNDSILVA